VTLSSCASTSTPSSNAATNETTGAAAGVTADKATSAAAKSIAQPSAEATKPQTSPAAKPQLAQAIDCKKTSRERAIEIHKIEGGCWLMYHNGTIKKRVAWSRNGIRHCESVRDNIRSNLEKSGWACTERTL
jgi:hypothetical protein